MGSLLAKKLHSYYKLVLVDKNLRLCGLLAKELNAISTSDYSMISVSDYIIIALPANIIHNVMKEIKPFLNPNQLLVNISTNTDKTTFNSLKGLCRFASAKIIGHARQISSGELPLIVIDGENHDDCLETADIFGKLGAVCFGAEKMVQIINSIASEEGIKAAFNIEKKLEEKGIPSEFYSFAIRNVACGTMNAYVLGDAGHFAQKIIDKLKKEQGKN